MWGRAPRWTWPDSDHSPLSTSPAKSAANTPKEERDLFQGRATSVHSHPEPRPRRDVDGDVCVLAVRGWVGPSVADLLCVSSVLSLVSEYRLSSGLRVYQLGHLWINLIFVLPLARARGMFHRVPVIITGIFIWGFPIRCAQMVENFDCVEWDFLLIFITNLCYSYVESQYDMNMKIRFNWITIIHDNDDHNWQNAVH